MRNIILGLVCFLSHLVSSQCAKSSVFLSPPSPPVCNSNDYIVVFEDNFDGTQLDLSKWNYPYQCVIRDFGFGTTEYEINSSNIELNNGIATIKAIKYNTPITCSYVEDWSTNPPTQKQHTFEFSSGEFWSNFRFEPAGVFEIKCKIPKGNGFWSAFWLFGADANGNSSEVDVFEFWGQKTFGCYDEDKSVRRMEMTLHKNYASPMCNSQFDGADFSASFHTFRVEIDPYYVAWFVDGSMVRLVKRYSIPGTGQTLFCHEIDVQQAYDQNARHPIEPMQIIASNSVRKAPVPPDDCELGPNSTTPFPGNFEIDFVRVYQRTTCVEEIIVNSQAQLDALLTKDFNVIMAKKVTLHNATLPTGKKLTVLYRESIDVGLGSNFILAPGSYFTTKHEPNLCPNLKTDPTPFGFMPKLTNPKTNYTAYNVSPNPTSNIVTVSLGVKDMEIHWQLINELGQCLFVGKNNGASTFDIEMSPFASGIYNLVLFNSQHERVFTEKICKK